MNTNYSQVTSHLLIKLVRQDRQDAKQNQALLINLLGAHHIQATADVLAHNPLNQQYYAYIQLLQPLAIPDFVIKKWSVLLGLNEQETLLRLCLLLDLQGATAPHKAEHHYCVEMRPEHGWELELQNWYAQEHLPGLAAVDGCIRARRWWTADQNQSSIASYELLAPCVLASKDWLAIRNTVWSNQVRPHFQNPLRTIMDQVSLN